MSNSKTDMNWSLKELLRRGVVTRIRRCDSSVTEWVRCWTVNQLVDEMLRQLDDEPCEIFEVAFGPSDIGVSQYGHEDFDTGMSVRAKHFQKLFQSPPRTPAQ